MMLMSLMMTTTMMMTTDPVPQSYSTGHPEMDGLVLLKFVDGGIFKAKERLAGSGELITRAEQLGAAVVYEREGESGYLQVGSYVVARFHLGDPTGW